MRAFIVSYYYIPAIAEIFRNVRVEALVKCDGRGSIEANRVVRALIRQCNLGFGSVRGALGTKIVVTAHDG